MTYPIISVDIDKVILDLANYRLPMAQASEADALKYLFASEEALEVVKSIAQVGYLDNEFPLVIPAEVEGGNKGTYIVMEGNRRVAALKAIHDPQLRVGFDKELASIRKKYSSELASVPREIRLMVIPDRETAIPHLGRMHIGKTKRAWGLDQQASFYYSLLDDDTSVDVLKAQYPGKPIIRLIKMASARRFITHVKFADSTLQDYAASSRLAMSSFEYAYNKPEIASLIGLKFTTQGLLEPSPEKAAHALSNDQCRALEILLSKYRSKELSTRTPALKKGTPQFAALLSELQGDKAQPDSHSTESDDDQRQDRGGHNDHGTGRTAPAAHAGGAGHAGGVSTQSGVQGASPRSERGSTHPTRRDRLNVSTVKELFQRPGIPPNMKDLFIELENINARNFRLATSMLMRSLLESVVKFYLPPDESGRQGRRLPTLGQLFQYINREFGGEGSPIGSGVSRIFSGRSHNPGSVKWFNAVTHDYEFVPHLEDVHNAWSVVYPVINHLIEKRLAGSDE
ncbi:hypothetical protein V3M68_03305 [Trueperella pyogenes]|uniref:hypothetical protein n=1 Tax=Trueperella pyogenes TaxID=1661 RepID=UPI00345C7A52